MWIVTEQTFGTMEQARDAERTAIKRSNPVHNVVGGNPYEHLAKRKTHRPTLLVGERIPPGEWRWVDKKPCVLYRAFNATGVLLYVGITSSYRSRMLTHERTSPWWPQVTKVTRDWHRWRKDAAVAEREAIRTEAPRYNIIENRNPRVKAAIEAMLATEPERRVVELGT